MCGTIRRAREGWGGVWGDGKGAGVLGRCVGRWEGRMRDKVVYVAMGRAHEGWDGGHSQKKTSESSPNHLYLMSECALSKHQNSIPFISKRLKTL